MTRQNKSQIKIEMTFVGARRCISPVLTRSLDNEVFLVVKKKPFCSFMASKGHSKMGGRVSCKVSENGNEGNSSSSKVSFKTKNNNMEDYNTAMKKMMRNPYEYHHDLGQCLSFSFFFIIVCDI